MNKDDLASIEAAVAEADALLRRQTKAPHVVMAMAPDGAAVIRGNVRAEILEAMAKGLLAIVAQERGKKVTKH